MRRIYLDYNSTTPLHPGVLEEMMPFFETKFGNPSSLHFFGRETAAALDLARCRAGKLIGADVDEIIFTSGGTESNNLALSGIARRLKTTRNHIITTSVEHSSVHDQCVRLESEGFKVTYLPVTRQGEISLNDLEQAVTEQTALISLILANNETGTVMNTDGVREIAKKAGALLHYDAVQAAGKIPVNVIKLGADLLSFSGHKIYGPKGSGVLFLRRGVALQSTFIGGEQENTRRSGTHNVPAIAGLGKACELAAAELDEYGKHCARLRDRLQSGILKIPDVIINGCLDRRIPNTLNASFPGHYGSSLAVKLDLAGIAVSTGSACSAGRNEESRVLKNMGLSSRELLGALRFSVGRHTTEKEIDYTVQKLAEIVSAENSIGKKLNIVNLDKL